MENVNTPKPVHQSESSVITHPYRYPAEKQFSLPTWGLLVILIVAFFILKYFIYIADEQRHGK